MTRSPLNKQSLEWTRPLLEELCVQVRQALEAFADDSSDQHEVLLADSIAACDKVAGSLSVLNFESGELMALAMRDALQSLEQGETDRQLVIQTVLEATAILPDYLDYVESTELDHIGLILPVINDLRAAAGQAALDKAEFFPVQLENIRPPSEQADGSSSFTELRREFQVALRDFLTSARASADLQPLHAAVVRVRNHPLLPNGLRRMAWALAGLAELIEANELSFSPDISRHFSRLDSLLREVCGDEDEIAISGRADSAARAILYLVATSKTETPTGSELRQAFDFPAALEEPELEAGVFLAGHNRELYAAVTQAAQEDLAKIKEVLGSQLESDRDPVVLEQQTVLLRSVGESLTMIGLTALGEKTASQASRLAEVGSAADDPVLLQVARELIVVESSLADGFSAAAAESLREGQDENLPGTLLPASEYRRVIRQLVQECTEDLAHAKHLLDTLTRGKAEDNAAGESRSILARVGGALRLAGIHDPASLIEAADRIIEAELLQEPQAVDAETLTILAETLTLTELQIENSTGDLSEQAQAQITAIRQKLAAHGWLDDAPDAEPTVDSAPAETSDRRPGVDETTTGEETQDPETISFEPAEDALPEPESSAQPPASALDDLDIVEIFLEEFEQEYETLQSALPVWQANPHDRDVAGAIRRTFHSLKGSGRMAGAEEIGDFSWEIENLLNQVVEGRRPPEPEVVDLVSEAVAALPSLRARLTGHGEQSVDSRACQDLANRAAALAEGRPADGTPRYPEMADLDETLTELMVKELSENLDTLAAWVDQSDSRETPGLVEERLVRAVHTMKGTMRLAPIGDECETAQNLESYLDELFLCHLPPSEAGQQAINDCLELFGDRLKRLQLQPVDDQRFDSAELARRLSQLHEQAHRKRSGDEPVRPTEKDAPTDRPAPPEADEEWHFGLPSAQDPDLARVSLDEDFFEVEEPEPEPEPEPESKPRPSTDPETE